MFYILNPNICFVGTQRNRIVEMVFEHPKHMIRLLDQKKMSPDMLFPTMWPLTGVDSDKLVQPPFKLRNHK